MPLPATLAPGPFSTSAARGLGVPAARLLRSDLVHPTRGSHALLGPTDLRERALAYAVGMPQERAFSHLTAAALHGLPLPRRLEASAREGELHVIAPTSDGRVAREGCVGHRGLERRHTEVIDGIRVTSLAETWCDFGELPRGLLTITDLVVLGDAVAARMDAQLPAECQPRAGDRRSRGIEDMQAALLRRVRPRGKRALVHALTLMRPRVRSAMETRASGSARATWCGVRSGWSASTKAVTMPISPGGRRTRHALSCSGTMVGRPARSSPVTPLTTSSGSCSWFASHRCWASIRAECFAHRVTAAHLRSRVENTPYGACGIRSVLYSRRGKRGRGQADRVDPHGPVLPRSDRRQDS